MHPESSSNYRKLLCKFAYAKTFQKLMSARKIKKALRMLSSSPSGGFLNLQLMTWIPG